MPATANPQTRAVMMCSNPVKIGAGGGLRPRETAIEVECADRASNNQRRHKTSISRYLADLGDLG
jgi:hypothetical protein